MPGDKAVNMIFGGSTATPRGVTALPYMSSGVYSYSYIPMVNPRQCVSVGDFVSGGSTRTIVKCPKCYDFHDFLTPCRSVYREPPKVPRPNPTGIPGPGKVAGHESKGRIYAIVLIVGIAVGLGLGFIAQRFPETRLPAGTAAKWMLENTGKP
jgi:hypothetical protein